MKILFTGGGSGGHFYPIIAVAEQIEKIVEERKLLAPSLYFMSPDVSDARMLYDHRIEHIPVLAGKRRLYFSPRNLIDTFKTALGTLGALLKMFSIFPDVVFSKGGYGSVPAVFAARILRIPIIIHESDSVPGRANKWAGKFADKVAVSYPETAEYFPKASVAWTGQPVRKTIAKRSAEEAITFLNLEAGVPVLLILGGSLGSEKINEAILGSLNDLLPNWQIVHQTGKANLADVTSRASVAVSDKTRLSRYHAFDYLSDSALGMAAGVSQLVISRAGSAIFEIASWGLPSIIIPITESNGDHQRNNAFNYLKHGCAIVIEENNLSPHILTAEAERIRTNEGLRKVMSESASKFHQPDGAFKIAKALVDVCLEHGSK